MLCEMHWDFGSPVNSGEGSEPFMLVLLVFGVPLAFGKGSRGMHVEWIGGDFQIEGHTVAVSLKNSFLEELKKDVLSSSQSNVVPQKLVRTISGSNGCFITPWVHS